MSWSFSVSLIISRTFHYLPSESESYTCKNKLNDIAFQKYKPTIQIGWETEMKWCRNKPGHMINIADNNLFSTALFSKVGGLEETD